MDYSINLQGKLVIHKEIKWILISIYFIIQLKMGIRSEYGRHNFLIFRRKYNNDTKSLTKNINVGDVN